eukprot:TRINITY_DN13685_c0_g1_i1.p1 TRINITY_DN13685_c0_g1~~TRINITY_DN13685_c0_g1_i1.p1  ORF type:complete len:122 (-),score=16.43 TRINITY_DN13685_c0_g1_i1:100-465(-)
MMMNPAQMMPQQSTSNGPKLDESHFPEHIMFNGAQLSQCKMLMSLVGGCVAGILGFEGVLGFLFFVGVTLFGGFMIELAAGFDLSQYFQGRRDVYQSGIAQCLLTYIMFWTLCFDIVHIYV